MLVMLIILITLFAFRIIEEKDARRSAILAVCFALCLEAAVAIKLL